MLSKNGRYNSEQKVQKQVPALLDPPGMVLSKICFWPGPEYLEVSHIL